MTTFNQMVKSYEIMVILEQIWEKNLFNIFDVIYTKEVR